MLTPVRTPRRPMPWLTTFLIVGAVGLAGCKGNDTQGEKGGDQAEHSASQKPSQPKFDSPAVSGDDLRKKASSFFAQLPEVAESPDNPLTDAKVDLGRMLYFDTRLSKNQDISCNTCHVLDEWGIDPREQDGRRSATSLGHRDQVGDRNSPTVYNAALHVAQFWDGRAADVEEQAKGPVLNPVEMAMPDEAYVLKVLSSIEAYEEKFAAAFPDDQEPITYENMAKAIGAFERKLMTPAPFDEFLAGKDTLSDQQLEGLKLFMDAGCTTCHNGPGIGGNQFQKLGNVKPWPSYDDEGRAVVTSSPTDKYVFKVPSLRNVTQTGPYLHDGSIDDLSQMVQLMAEHQTARGKLADGEVQAIVAFLGSLEGTLPTDYIARPTLPESGPDTPGPDPS